MSAWCDRCERSFRHANDRNSHLARSNNHHYCRRCGRDFSSPSALSQHKRCSNWHHICGGCGADFSDRFSLDEHIDDDHWHCGRCDVFLDHKSDLEKHYAKSSNHHYCLPCKREFQGASQLDSHLRSAFHAGRTFQCPGCPKTFPTISAMTIHLESGTCRSGATRQKVDAHVRSLDPKHLVTLRLLEYPGRDGGGGSVDTWATEAARNGDRYECYFCHRTFRQLQGLNAHLKSPVHQSKMYYCPKCQTEFHVFSALIQHVESGSCGIARFKETQKIMNGLTHSLTKRLAYS